MGDIMQMLRRAPHGDTWTAPKLKLVDAFSCIAHPSKEKRLALSSVAAIFHSNLSRGKQTEH